jgi:hypothetical protein
LPVFPFPGIVLRDIFRQRHFPGMFEGTSFNRRRSMILKYLLFLSIFIFLVCQGCGINDKNRKNHKWTSTVCDSLYAETFTIFGQGAFGGDRDGRWLTDSTNFRIYLGAFDEGHGTIVIKCKSDSILVTQFPDDLDVNKHLKEPVTKTYRLKELKRLNNLNDF